MSHCCDFCVENGCYACCTCGDSFEPEDEGVSEPVTIWIIRDVLTKGIVEAQGAYPTLGGTRGAMNWSMDTYRRDEYELSLLDARIKAILQRKDRINELRNEISRLEELEF